MKKYIKSAKDYGGAYDIDPQALFTGEEIRDLAYEVCDIVNSRYDSNFDVSDIDYTPEDNEIYIEIMNSGGYTYGTTFRLDLRKFRFTFNLVKAYADLFADNLIKQIEDDKIYSSTKGDKMKKYVKSSLVDTPQEVIDELIDILGEYGFILDPAFKTNPGRTWLDNVHIQVIMPDTYIEDMDEIQDYVPREMIDDIHELEVRSDCPITWSFGANAEGQITGGLDIMKKYIAD